MMLKLMILLDLQDGLLAEDSESPVTSQRELRALARVSSHEALAFKQSQLSASWGLET